MKKLLNNLNKVLNKLKQLDIYKRAASLSFYILLAIVPVLFFLIEALQSFNINLLTLLGNTYYIPNDIKELINNILSTNNNIGSFYIFFIIFTVYLISRVVYELVDFRDSLDNNYSLSIKIKLKIMLKLFILLLSLIVIIVLLVISKMYINYFKDINAISFIYLFTILRFILSVLVPSTTLFMLYKFLFRKNYNNKALLLGSLITTLFWILSSTLFSLYLKYFASYDKLYGTFTILVILAYWIYLLSIGFLLGIYSSHYLNKLLNVEKNNNKNTRK